jgi:transcriptional regulator with GAF, ATPase, and Fis domain
VTREAQLNETFVELADTLVNPFDVADLLHTLATRCVELFDLDAAALMLTDQGGNLRVVASSIEQARILELLELQNQEGPCLDCFRSGEPVAEGDLASSDRWPGFSAEALAADFHSVLALPMRLRDDVIGAMNLFRLPAGRLDDADVDACQALADVATISLLQDRAIQEGRLLTGPFLFLLLRNRAPRCLNFEPNGSSFITTPFVHCNSLVLWGLPLRCAMLIALGVIAVVVFISATAVNRN